MHRIKVVSTDIESIGFAFHVSFMPLNTIQPGCVSLGDIEVEFKNGTIGIYRDVLYSVYRTVINADSVGRALRYHVRLAGYKWETICSNGVPC